MIQRSRVFLNFTSAFRKATCVFEQHFVAALSGHAHTHTHTHPGRVWCWQAQLQKPSKTCFHCQPSQFQHCWHGDSPHQSQTAAKQRGANKCSNFSRQTQDRSFLIAKRKAEIRAVPSISAPSSSSGFPPSTFAAMLFTMFRMASKKKNNPEKNNSNYNIYIYATRVNFRQWQHTNWILFCIQKSKIKLLKSNDNCPKVMNFWIIEEVGSLHVSMFIVR